MKDTSTTFWQGVERYSGAAAIVGGAIWTGRHIALKLAPTHLPAPSFELINPLLEQVHIALFGLSAVLFIVALLGLYRRQMVESGLLGKGGIALSGLGFAICLAAAARAITLDESYWYVLMVGMLTALVGLALLGISSLKTGALGGWSFVPLALVAFLLVAMFANPDMPPYEPLLEWTRFACMLLFGVGWMALGYALSVKRYARLTPATA